jgi:c-di-GMP-binding flagellar brake protein YcgR
MYELFKNTNQRTSPRKIIDIPIFFGNQGDMLSGRTIDLSETGLSIVSDILFEVGTDVDLWLDRDSDYIGFHSKVVRHIEDELENSSTGLEFLNLNDKDRYNLRLILNLPFDANITDYNAFPYTLNLSQSNHKIISDETIIDSLINQIYSEKVAVYVKPHIGPSLVPFILTSIDTVSMATHFFCISRFDGRDNHDFSNYKELILFVHYQLAFYVLKTRIVHMEHGNIYLELPHNVIQLWRRSHPKSRLELADKNITSRIITDKNNEYILTVNDIGYRGVSLNLPDRNTAGEIGNSPVNICVKIDDGQDISFEASLKYLDEKLSAAGNIYKCGFEISRIDPAMKENMGAYIFKHNYPHIVLFNEKYIDKIWDLFFKSGYMIPEKREYVSKVKKEIEETWIRLYGEDSKIGKMLLFVDNNEIYGTIAAAQAYENTWMIHQVAGLKHPMVKIGKYILDSIAILMIEHLDMKYAKAEFRKENDWAIKNFFKFHEYCTLENAILYSFLDLYEIDIDKYKFFKFNNINIEIDYLSSAEDRLFITDYLAKSLPELAVNTESINNSGLELPVTQLAYRNIGLFRGRKILMAKENKRIISFAVLEYGSTGINLGGMLDVFKIFTIEPSNENLNIINRILINEIIDFYNSIGKKSALCLTNDINKYVLEAAGLTKRLDYIMWYFNNDSFKQITQYFYNSYAPLKERAISK